MKMMWFNADELVGDYDLKVMRQEFYISRQKVVGLLLLIFILRHI